jgi:hypothetical protein
MATADLVAVVVVIVAVAATTALLFGMVRLVVTVRRVQAAAERCERSAAALTEELLTLSRRAGDELDRAAGALDRAESVVGAIEGASRLTYRTVANPVIKVAAAASGVRRGADRLRRPDRTGETETR